MSEQDYWTIKAMKIYGGGFIKALAEAASHADPANLVMIKTTWHNNWKNYEEMGERLKANK